MNTVSFYFQMSHCCDIAQLSYMLYLSHLVSKVTMSLHNLCIQLIKACLYLCSPDQIITDFLSKCYRFAEHMFYLCICRFSLLSACTLLKLLQLFRQFRIQMQLPQVISWTGETPSSPWPGRNIMSSLL